MLSGGQVSCLSAVDKYLYIGTTRGSILVTTASTLLPLCVFQCHGGRDFYIKVILPILPYVHESNVMTQREENEERDDGSEEFHAPGVLSVGRGYANAIKVCQGCKIWAQSGSHWPQMGTNQGLLQIIFQ